LSCAATTLVMASDPTEYLCVIDGVWTMIFSMSSALTSGCSFWNVRSAPIVVCLLRHVE
jgi:hypothetical protein